MPLPLVVRRAALAAVVLFAATAHASFHTFQIEELYSNADGTLQFIVLHESQGASNENFLGGHVLTVTHAGSVKTYTFDVDLPGGGGMYGGGGNTAFKRVLIATAGFASLGLVAPDYVVPNQFLPTDGGTVDYASVDQVSFASLPIDGVSAWYRTGAIDVNRATDFANKTASLPAMPVGVVEYYNAGLDHYFVSALEPDIDALDSGRIAGWARTGLGFKVFPTAAAGGPGVDPVCRFYIPPEHGNSHFISASPAECAAILQKVGSDPNYSGYVYETPNAFYVALPDTATGVCPAGTQVVYRLWNGRADSNHRYTASADVKTQMLARGYQLEGYGPPVVDMCAPM